MLIGFFYFCLNGEALFGAIFSGLYLTSQVGKNLFAQWGTIISKAPYFDGYKTNLWDFVY